jgi:hypothetical protein
MQEHQLKQHLAALQRERDHYAANAKTDRVVDVEAEIERARKELAAVRRANAAKPE